MSLERGGAKGKTSGQPAASGVVYLSASSGATALLAYALHAVAARWFSPVGYGPFAVAISLILWLKILLHSVLLPGFRKAVSEDPSRLRATVRLGWRWYAPIVAGVLLVFLAAIPLLARLLGDPRLTWLLLLAALDLPLAAVHLFAQALLNGLRQYRLMAASLLFYSIGRSAGALGLIVLGFGAGAALGGLAMGSAVGAAVAVVGLASRWKQEPDSPYPELLRRSWSWTAAVVPSAFGWATLGSLDLWVVQALSPTADAAGLYAAAFMVAQVPHLILQGLTMSIFPRVSGALASGATALARSVTAQALRLAILALPGVCVVVAVSAPEILSLLMSSEYSEAGPVLRVLFTATSLGAAAEMLLGIPAAADRPRIRTVVILAMLGVQAALLVVLVPAWGGLGAAYAMLVSLGGGAATGMWLTYHYTGAVPPRGTLLRVLVASTTVGLAGSWWKTAGSALVLEGMVLGAVYLGVLALLGEIGAKDLRDLGRALRPKVG